MKVTNYIKSSLFLLAILFSFSVNAYNSLTQLSSSHIASLKKVNVDQPAGSALATDTILFEELENENDSDSFSSETFLVLPFYLLAFALIASSFPVHFFSAEPGTTEPIFLSIRVLRI